MENDPLRVDFPIKNSIYRGFSMGMLNNQMVITRDQSVNLHQIYRKLLPGAGRDGDEKFSAGETAGAAGGVSAARSASAMR